MMVHKKFLTSTLLVTCLYAAHGVQATQPIPSAPTTAATSTLDANSQPTTTPDLATTTQAQPKAADQRNNLRMFAKFAVDAIVVLIVSFLMTFIKDGFGDNTQAFMFWDALGILCFVIVVAYIVTYIFGFFHGLINTLFEPSPKEAPTLDTKPATATTSAPSAVPSTSTPKSTANTVAV